MIYDEQQALSRLGINSFSEMTRDRVPAFAQLIPEMDPQLTLKALGQFPAYANYTSGILNCYMDAARSALNSGSESARSAALTVQTAANALSKQLESEELSWITRSDINDKLIELAHLAAKLDRNHKSFLVKLASIAGGVVTVIAGPAAVIIGSRNSRR